MEKYVQRDGNGNIFVPLGQVNEWKERYKKQLDYN